MCCSFTLSQFPCFVEDPDGTKHSFIASKTLPDGSLPFPEFLHINVIQDYDFCDDFVFSYGISPHLSRVLNMYTCVRTHEAKFMIYSELWEV